MFFFSLLRFSGFYTLICLGPAIPVFILLVIVIYLFFFYDFSWIWMSVAILGLKCKYVRSFCFLAYIELIDLIWYVWCFLRWICVILWMIAVFSLVLCQFRDDRWISLLDWSRIIWILLIHVLMLDEIVWTAVYVDYIKAPRRKEGGEVWEEHYKKRGCARNNS